MYFVVLYVLYGYELVVFVFFSSRRRHTRCSGVSWARKMCIRDRNKSNDGFFIAEEDLKLRGPGDLFGIRQSGDLEFTVSYTHLTLPTIYSV